MPVYDCKAPDYEECARAFRWKAAKRVLSRDEQALMEIVERNGLAKTISLLSDVVATNADRLLDDVDDERMGRQWYAAADTLYYASRRKTVGRATS